MSDDGVSDVPGATGWRYEGFRHDEPTGLVHVPVRRLSDGKRAEFALPDFVNDPADIAAVAAVVIDAIQRWEAVEGLGA